MAVKKKMNVFIAINKQALTLAKEKTEALANKTQMLWIGVKKVFFDKLQAEKQKDYDVPFQGRTEYWHIDEWYMPIDKIGEQDNMLSYQKEKPSSKKDKKPIKKIHNQGFVFNDQDEDIEINEKAPKKYKRITRQEKGDKKTKSERYAEKREELKRKKEEKAQKAAEKQRRLAKKLGKSILD